MSKKHANIALFVPHLGCPHECVFCNQRSISGKLAVPALSEFERQLDAAALQTKESGIKSEIAFFGGSFTGIERGLMVKLLSLAKRYVDAKAFSGIRISTRPDFIDDEILSVLKKYGVTAIELGAQSMDDEVLKLSRRGHTAEDVRVAAKLIKQYGFELGLQMMVGLPGDSAQKDIYTAHEFVKLKPETVRIYPTVVIKDTELARMMKSGEYRPLSVDEAVAICKRLLLIFNEAGIAVIRLGLHAEAELTSGDAVEGGAFHPSFRELVEGEIFYDNAVRELELANVSGEDITLTVARGAMSKMTGHRRKNIGRLKERYNLRSVKVVEDNDLSGYEIKVLI